jgi:hypothetical protein
LHLKARREGSEANIMGSLLDSTVNRSAVSRRRSTALAALALFALTLQQAEVHGQAQPLQFFKNYFVTGDYVVRGVSLWRKGVNGRAVADIPALGPSGGPGGVPANADILAAFLYVQTAERIQGSGIDNAKFLGNNLGPFTKAGSTIPGSGTFAKPLVNWDAASLACWSVAFPGKRKLITYRTDVLRFLPIDPKTGKQALNKPHRINIPDAGNLFDDDDESHFERGDLTGPRAVGASLVVVYRDPSKPLSAIVLYDGAFTKRAFARMDQPIEGFYQSSVMKPAAKMTHIVGDGRPFLFERVLLGGRQIALNPYVSADGPKWDNPTFNNLPLPGNADSTTVSVDNAGWLSDCVSFSAIVFKTTVEDSDNDSLLNIWESSASTLHDPAGEPLPNLHDMGADPNVPDVFAEVAYMHAQAGTTYGGEAKPQHSHLPSYEALKMVGDAFKNAPMPVNVHFDVGNAYQTNADGTPTDYIIRADQARGGKNISETMACVDASGQITECLTAGGQQPIPGQYPQYPGTVGWKTGFKFLRDEILGFDRNRKDMFRYVLFGHSLGMPKEPCLRPDGTSDFTCQDTNPDFHVPVTNSGIADFPGGDLLVTLGAFVDADGLPVGSPFMQGSTIMHEWGHTFELTHAGTPTIPREPNCKPNYLSVMNYLFQLRGLLDPAGLPRMDFARGTVGELNEFSLSDGPLPALAPLYRTGWYAKKDSSYLKGVGAAATKHCDGSELTQAEKDDLNRPDGLGGMVRVDAIDVAGAIDWNANGLSNLAFTQDINFDGLINGTPVLKAAPNDWLTLRLTQLGSRRNVGGYYIDTNGRNAVGPMSLDIGRGDIGRGDIGRGDIGRGDIGLALGRGDIGRGDIGRGDIGRGDIGRGDIGRGDIGRGLFGGGDLDVGGANEPRGDINLETARAVTGNAPSPPSGLSACLTNGEGGCAREGGTLPVRLDWQAPHLGTPVQYIIYRFEFQGEFTAPANLPTEPIATVGSEGGLPTMYLDYTAPSGANLAYFVRARFNDQSMSGISNFATIATPPLRLVFVVQPGSSAPNRPMAPVQVGVQDVRGNLMNVTGLPIAIALGNNPSEAVLNGTRLQNTVNGVATFSDLSIDKAGTGYTLVATSNRLTSATSEPFDVLLEPLTILTGSLPDGTQGAPYSQIVAAKGGVPPYRWDVKPIYGFPDFNLPDGLRLSNQPDGTGLVAGTPTTVQTRSFRLRVTDATGQAATQDLCIHIDESHEGTLDAVASIDDAPLDPIAQLLVGEGQAITISNVQYTGARTALGTFSGGFAATGLGSGVILSSGTVANVNPPNTTDNASFANGLAGDPDLQELIPGIVTSDAAVLEFDFTVTDPNATSVKFDYVFASEEYNEFVNSQYNDVFGFFMSGPDFPKRNLALVPNTDTPVSINNVNGGNPFGTNAHNADQFINNDLSDGGGQIGTQADGLTKVFTITAAIKPQVTYHLKLAVSDAGVNNLGQPDYIYDSFVLIKAGSFAAVCPIIPNCPSCSKD